MCTRVIRVGRHNGNVTAPGKREMATRSVTPPDPMNSALEALPGLRQDRAQDALDLVEVLLPADQRRGELDDGVAAVVGAADEPGVEQRVREEPAQQPLGLLVAERLAGGLVLDHLDAVEIPGAAD